VISTEHPKHPKLVRPNLGEFARNEWAILGAPCSTIQNLAKQLIGRLSTRYQCGYVDTKHPSPDESTQLPGMLEAGAAVDYLDAIENRQVFTTATWGIHQQRTAFNGCDVVLVNGNHHLGAKQVVILDVSKLESLKRRAGQLTQVGLLLTTDKDSVQVIEFLKEVLPEIAQIPQLPIQDLEAIIRFFEAELQQNKPLLNGLVLAGGQSQRMGRDKGALTWHGKPQREFLADMLEPVCAEVFISCRAEQAPDLPTRHQVLTDTFLELGPFGALLSAFRAQPDRAWLVVACDLPLLDQHTLDFLIAARCVKKIATAFTSPTDQMPEPLITIWEPKAYAVILSFLAQGYSCLRKVLIQSEAQLLTAPDPEALSNVNTREEWEAMLRHPLFLK
jgi:molybdopterin-guanine dinucleotide biosynthesis protein A